MPLRKRSLKGLSKHRGQKKEQRGYSTSTDSSQGRFAHRALLCEEFWLRTDGCASATGENQGKHGLLRENHGAAKSPGEGRPIPLHVVQFGQDRLSPREAVLGGRLQG